MSDNVHTSQQIVVGIGASAGGLEAFQMFIKGLPDEHDLVLILVQHLDPDHDSLMPELIGAKTKTPVHSVTDGMKIEPRNIYLIPPGYEMEIKGDTLHLKDFSNPRGLRRPIDRFFRSLADQHGENAVAVVLSGTGSDGASGAREVKGHGGLVFVQDPKQAKYDGMPQSVLDMSGADVTLNAEEMIEVVNDYFNLRAAVDSQDEATDYLARIMRHVRFRTGYDFTQYKEATMRRRVAVRMTVLNLSSHGEYLKYLADNKSEADLLFQDLLINVTSFFRDAEHFQSLREDVIPELVEDATEHGELRVWIAGASTGEEAYTVAMLINEELTRANKACNVIVFGTDIDETALATARAGRYGDGIVDAIPKPLLDRYFTPRRNGYEVNGLLREMVRFSRHSFIKDPPFSKIDLVSCRNVMIYFNAVLQELTMRVFHYALREGGFLFIGPSENPRAIGNYFTEVAGRSRIFARRPGPARPLNLTSPSGRSPQKAVAQLPDGADNAAIDKTERIILDEFAPAYLHVSNAGDVLFSTPNASKYLGVRSGKMTTNLFNMINPKLEATFRRLTRDTSLTEIEFQGLLQDDVERLIVSRRELKDGSSLYVIRDNLQLLDSRAVGTGGPSEKQDAYVQHLENELDNAQQTVRVTVEELETSNEELKSSNEEMMSMNEELQSANEELTTINDELQEKLHALNQANVDLSNFVESARVPTVFLDEDVKLVNFTPETQRYFSFTENDIGRALVDLNSEIDQNRIVHLCELTVQDREEREFEFTTKDGKETLLVRVMPYSPDGKDAIGAVFTLQDISELRAAVKTADTAKEFAELQRAEIEQIYFHSPVAMGMFDSAYRYTRLNAKLAAINNLPIDRHLGNTVRDIIPSAADQTEGIIDQIFETRKPVLGMQIVGTTTDAPDDVRTWSCDWQPFYSGNEMRGVSVTARDVTDELKTEDNLRRIMRELEHRVKNMLANVNALVNRAAREATTDKAVYQTLTQRIQGLSKTHALLTAEQWSAAPLRSVIKPETIDVYGADRVTLSGPNIKVTAEATLALGMAIHELATNAAKYGAFSEPDGKVSVTWSRVTDANSDRLIIEWQESDGPPVTAPEDAGFGSRLIKTTIEGNLEGNVTLDWEPNGVRAVIELEFDTVTAS